MSEGERDRRREAEGFKGSGSSEAVRGSLEETVPVKPLRAALVQQILVVAFVLFRRRREELKDRNRLPTQRIQLHTHESDQCKEQRSVEGKEATT